MKELWIIFYRTILFYVVVLVIFRLMGKREIGELNVLDLVVFLMIGEIAILAIEEPQESIANALVPMITLLCIQIVVARLSLKSKTLRKFIDGNPTIIIRDGKIDENAMRQLRYNFDDLLMQLRTKNINNISDVAYAILETSGQLSVIKKGSSDKQPQTYTLPLIADGTIRTENLKKIEKTEKWLHQELKKRGYENISNISFCSYQDGQLFIDVKDEKK